MELTIIFDALLS